MLHLILQFVSLKEPDKTVQTISFFKSLFFNKQLDRRRLTYGLLFLWRLPSKDGTLRDFDIFFIPCEPKTGVPAFSEEERETIRTLTQRNITFRKPLIMPKGFHQEIIYEHKER